MNVNVAVCTYQNERFLDRCLTDIEQTVPINRLIIVNHYSANDCGN
jgi:glycosyltransferase involved in cell wall biosynthesis